MTGSPSLRKTPWALLGCVLLLSGGLHLAFPSPAAHRYSAPLAGPFDYAFSTDSAAFARLVVRFPEGFTECEQGRVRILRPLYPALGRLLYLPLRPLAAGLPEGLAARISDVMARANHPGIWAGIGPRDVAAAWVALILVNFLLAWAAAGWLFRALERMLPPELALPLALLPALHFDSIDFLLVPHTEVFNLLVPALAMRVALSGGGGATRGSALALGVLMLGKGIVFPFAGWLHDAWRVRRQGFLLRAAVLAACFALPMLLYSAWLLHRGLSVYSHEMGAGRQGVWMLDLARSGAAASIPAAWLRGLATHAACLAKGCWIPGLGIAGLLLLPVRKAGALPPAGMRALAVYAAASAAFWCLVGNEQVRHGVLDMPWIAAVLGALAAGRCAHPARLAWGVLALQALAYAAGMFRL